MRTFISPLAALCAACLAGCQPQYVAPTTQPQPMSAAEKDFEAVWEASLQTLREYYFEVDRQDRRAGVITTKPMTGMHFFELWRRDAARPADFGESTLQTIYRTAQVAIRPTQPDGQIYQAQVEVLLRRSNRPRTEVTSTSEAYGLFTSGRRRKQRDVPLGIGAMPALEYATDLGNDRSLEAKLTAEIAAAADRLRGIVPAPATQPAGKPQPSPASAPAASAPAGEAAPAPPKEVKP